MEQEKLDALLEKARKRPEYQRGLKAREQEVRRFGIGLDGEPLYPEVLRSKAKSRRSPAAAKSARGNVHTTIPAPKKPAVPAPTEVEAPELKRREDGTWVQADFF
jgi:hypothetical protein